MNGLATIVATQSLPLGAVSANSAIRCCFFIAILVVVAVATIVVVSSFWISSKMADFDVSQKYDDINRIFKKFKTSEYSSLHSLTNRSNNTVNPSKLLIRKVSCL